MFNRLAVAAGVALAVSVIALDVRADETNPTIVHRQGIFKVASGHMTGLKSILVLKNGPTANLTYHADGVLAAFQHLGDAFPAGTDKGETKAKPEIWTDRAKFDAAGKKAHDAAVAMADAAKTGNTDQAAEAFKTLGKACKACHEDFKKD
ncbi:MAG: cytochrome c [Alphaproteobacteria bacterium]